MALKLVEDFVSKIYKNKLIFHIFKADISRFKDLFESHRTWQDYSMTLILLCLYVGILAYMYSLLTSCLHVEVPFGSVS